MSFHHLDPTTAEAHWRQAGVADLPQIDPELSEQWNSLVVLAAHPDDEALGCAGLLTAAAHHNLATHVILCSAGEDSHPVSPTHTPQQLAELREQEFHQALNHLHFDAQKTLLGLPDGRLDEHTQTIMSHLLEAVAAASKPTLLVAPLHNDGHTDHDTLGHLALEVGQRMDVSVAEYPIWYWHWATPSHQQWRGWQRYPDLEGLDRAALHDLYPSQTKPLSDYPGDEAIVGAEFLAHFQRGFDTFAITPRAFDAQDAAGVFNRLHEERSDPWALASSSYERNKRRALLTMLGSDAEHTLEVGCSIGSLAVELAQRSTRVTAVDASQEAISSAKQLYGAGNIDFQCLTVPFDWPSGTFDVVVLSEVGYFMSAQQLQATLERIQDSTTPRFRLALCHFRGTIDHWPLDAETVHRQCQEFWPQATVIATAHTENYLMELLDIDRRPQMLSSSHEGGA